MKTDTYLLRLGEVTLKKRNRKWFINNLIKIIKPRIKHLNAALQRRHKKLLLITEAPESEVKQALSTVFGLVGVSPIYRTSLDLNEIKTLSLELMKPFFGSGQSFSVKAKRVKKDYALKSPQLQEEIAGHLFENGLDLPVNLKHPELSLGISIEFHEVWVHVEVWPGLGGLPVSTKNKYGLLLSGGIDSPVAGNLIQKRGGSLVAVYFHTPPYTVESAKDKVLDLAQILASYQNGLDLHVVHFTEVMKTLKVMCHDSLIVVLSRRFMMRVAEKILIRVGCDALVTGESLGQVASQTIENIRIVSECADLPILRPLIGMDKGEIIQRARKMGSFETSIRPYDDCCSLFAPEEPATRATHSRIQREEAKLNIDELVQRAVDQTELISLTI